MLHKVKCTINSHTEPFIMITELHSTILYFDYIDTYMTNVVTAIFKFKSNINAFMLSAITRIIQDKNESSTKVQQSSQHRK